MAFPEPEAVIRVLAWITRMSILAAFEWWTTGWAIRSGEADRQWWAHVRGECGGKEDCPHCRRRRIEQPAKE
jgi:hypothetical protein